MKLLILDETHESQTKLAAKTLELHPLEVEKLDLQINLVGELDYQSKLAKADVVVLGAGLGDRAFTLAKCIRQISPEIHLIMYASGSNYTERNFKIAYSAGIQKVLSEHSSSLDLLQELLSIHKKFRQEGKTSRGELVVVTGINGGVGVTTLCAALGELCSDYSQKVLLWDLDFETRDLSRALLAFSGESEAVSGWINGTEQLTRDNLLHATIPIGTNASLLMPPHRLAEGLDLLCHPDGLDIAQRILALARVQFDLIIVDAGGIMGPTKGYLMHQAEKIALMLGNSALSCSGVETFMSVMNKVIESNSNSRLSVICQGGGATLQDVAKSIAPSASPSGPIPSQPLLLPHDPLGAFWAGTNKTLYSLGDKTTQQNLIRIASSIGLIEPLEDETITMPLERLSARILKKTGIGEWGGLASKRVRLWGKSERKLKADQVKEVH